MWPMILNIAGAAGTAAFAPEIIEKTQRIIDQNWGTDYTGSKRRANLLGDAQWRSLMGDEVEAQDTLAYEQVLNDLLSPLSQVEPWDGLSGVKNFIQERELNDVVARDQMRLGQLSQVYQDNSFEALAMRMGL